MNRDYFVLTLCSHKSFHVFLLLPPSLFLRSFVLVHPAFGADWQGFFQVIKLAAALETHVFSPKALFIHRFPLAKMFAEISGSLGIPLKREHCTRPMPEMHLKGVCGYSQRLRGCASGVRGNVCTDFHHTHEKDGFTLFGE